MAHLYQYSDISGMHTPFLTTTNPSGRMRHLQNNAIKRRCSNFQNIPKHMPVAKRCRNSKEHGPQQIVPSHRLHSGD